MTNVACEGGSCVGSVVVNEEIEIWIVVGGGVVDEILIGLEGIGEEGRVKGLICMCHLTLFEVGRGGGERGRGGGVGRRVSIRGCLIWGDGW